MAGYDLSGKRFGRLTAIKIVGRDSNKNNIWQCICECGNIVNVPATRLVRGVTKSCGCLVGEIAAELAHMYKGKMRKDLTGMKFGLLTAIKYIPSTICDGKLVDSKWLCRCECGNYKAIDTSHLIAGKIRSCGCRTGEFISESQRRQNPYRVLNGICVVFEDDSKKELFICDPDDIDLLSRHFFVDNTGYAACTDGRFHSLVAKKHQMATGNGYVIDHINHIKTDNRKCNLRSVRQADNIKNSVIRLDNKTGYKGVSTTRSNRFSASITCDGNVYYLGTFETAERANAAREQAEEKLFGQYSFSASQEIAKGYKRGE